MKYKVGDKVRIKSKEWYIKNANEDGEVDVPWVFNKKMSAYCGMIAEIVDISGDLKYYRINLDNKEWVWTDEMFEDSTSRIEEKPTISEQMIKDIAEVIKKHNLGVCVSENEGKIIIEPLNEKEEDLPIDTPCMTSDDRSNWFLRYYARDSKCFAFPAKSENGEHAEVWKYIIPFNKFNPNDIDESLKYNIVK